VPIEKMTHKTALDLLKPLEERVREANTSPDSPDEIEYEIRSGLELDGYYLQWAMWSRELDEATLRGSIVCQAWAGDPQSEVGVLAIDSDGLILVVSVEPDYRRQGIATRMYRELVAAGYQPQHDWGNLRTDGAAWAASLGAS
jgi:ribosomal protein S18 acetylase RimI-like enzyme